MFFNFTPYHFIMRIVCSLIIFSIFIFSCTPQNGNTAKAIKKVNTAWLDSVTKNSDSSFVKPYKRTDFATATYYTNKKDSSLCQLMKDSAGIIRQIIIVTKNIRTFFGQYYKNGQLQADLPLDEFGQYHGAATNYFEDGVVESSGSYVHGLKAGTWKNFNKTGKFLSTDEYNQNGQLVKTTSQ
jgi:antitoxin component YwqK of YwqJK toxin-antitoxin module